MTWSFSNVVALASMMFALASIAVNAHAQTEPTPADVESAKIQFTEGNELRHKGDLACALGRFRAAYALVPTPITGLEVGRALIDTGKILEGRALLLEVSRMPKKPGESDRAEAAREEAAKLADDARAKLATLTVDTAAPDAALTIDDVVIPSAATHAPRVLDPGHHSIVLRSHGHVGRADVDVQPGEQRVIRVDADQEEPSTPHAYRRHPGPLFYASVIASGVTLALGVGTGIGALATASGLSTACPNHQCSPANYGQLDASTALGWTSTVSLAASGAFAVLAVIVWATSDKIETRTGLHLAPGVGTFSLTGIF